MLKRMSKRISLCLALCGSLALHNAIGGGTEIITPLWTPLAPGISVAGAFGQFNSGWADAMVPVYGLNPTSFFYLDPQVLFHSGDQYSASIGGGFRTLNPDYGILGAYVFGDYNRSEQNHAYFFVSPGLERLGEILDFSVNAYIPVSQQRFNNPADFETVGSTSTVNFSGHDELNEITEFQELFQHFESTGVGVDGEIGYRLPVWFWSNNTKLYLGGYYFSPKDTGSITGGMARLEMPLTNYLSVSVSDNYDNVFHNTVRAGLTLDFWGRSTHATDYSLPNRLVDPIQRNRIAIDGHSGTDQYIATGKQDLGIQNVEVTDILIHNIWFFRPGGIPLLPESTGLPVTPDQCTFENPCAATDVNTTFFAGIDAIAPNALMYLAPGTYSNLDNQGDAGNGTLVVNAGQTMWGRTADYKLAASGSDRANLIGGLDLNGNSLLDSLILANDANASSIPAQAILIENNAQTITLSNLLIGNTGLLPSETYITGLLINGGNHISISNSEIDAYNQNFTAVGTANATGINNASTSTGNEIDIENSVINANANAPSFEVLPFVSNIINNGHNNLWQLINDQLTVSTLAIGGSGSAILDQGSGYGQWILTSNQITVVASNNSAAITVTSSSANNSWEVANNQVQVTIPLDGFNAAGFDDAGSNSHWTLTGNVMHINGVEVGGALVTEPSATNATWILNSNQIFLFDSGSNVAHLSGIWIQGNNSQLTSTNDYFNVVANGSLTTTSVVYDILNQSTASVIKLTNDQFFSSINATADVLGSGLISAYGILDQGSQNVWSVTNNRFTVINSSFAPTGTLFLAVGIESSGQDTWNLSGNQINVNSSSLSSTTRASESAVGFLVNGNTSTITSNNDTFIVSASESVTSNNAYGIAANILGTTASGNTITLTGDTIQVTAANAANAAYGVFDTNNTINTWNPGSGGSASANATAIITANPITATATGGTACKVGFGVGCFDS